MRFLALLLYHELFMINNYKQRILIFFSCTFLRNVQQKILHQFYFVILESTLSFCKLQKNLKLEQSNEQQIIKLLFVVAFLYISYQNLASREVWASFRKLYKAFQKEDAYVVCTYLYLYTCNAK